MKNLILLIFVLHVSIAFTQKKTVNHTVYNEWKTLKNETIASDGNHVAYVITPHRGDGTLNLHSNGTKNRSFIRGKKPVFSHSSDFLYFLIDPGYDTIRQLKLQKVKKEEWVKDTLAILNLQNDSLSTYANIKSFKVAEEGQWIAFLQATNERESKPKKKGLFSFLRKKVKDECPNSKGHLLTLFNPVSRAKKRFYDVTSYEFDKRGNTLAIVSHQEFEAQDTFKVQLQDLSNLESAPVISAYNAAGNYTFNNSGNQFSFLASKDTVKEHKVFDLYLWNIGDSAPRLVIDTNRADLPKGMTVSNYYRPNFSKDGSKLYLGIKKVPTQDPKDTLLKSEKAQLDLWHYEDHQLQPQQLKQRKRRERLTHQAVWHVEDDNLVMLGDDTLRVSFYDKGDSDFGLGRSAYQYEASNNWNYPWPADYYRINLNTGNKELLKRKVTYVQGLSPQGKYFIYFNSNDQNYYYDDLLTGDTKCITCFTQDTTIVWISDVNGMPHDPAPLGIVGFTENDRSVILNSKYDVWEVELVNNSLNCITNHEGKLGNTIMRLKTWEPDSTYIDLSQTYVHGTDQATKDEHIYKLSLLDKVPGLEVAMLTNHKILSINKADRSNKVIYRKMNVKDYPDLYLTDTTFHVSKKISETNPQQDEFRWPTVEQIQWTSPEGKELEGLIYKPEDFDSTKSYPMLVYFYELYNDRKHVHYIPKPTASIIYATEYTSAEYVVFIPDVRYDPGHPAKGAYDCIMSGTDEVLKKYPNIDSTRMGLQGQSWGGYQTAQLVTMTNRYKAAMAGAPVSNMFSAYGGIRWGSGLNRQFQYERTQSRIGKTIWEAPELYVENSPLFGIPNIETPLLIMHNDNDGAVPWYQGIEMFVGMKRLGKPAWLLNYNGDEHNLMQNANRMDLSIRMRQFFDYYLKDEPAPKWLIDGIPATEKGKDYRLELLEVD